MNQIFWVKIDECCHAEETLLLMVSLDRNFLGGCGRQTWLDEAKLFPLLQPE